MLNEKAMLVSLHISLPPQTKTAKEASAEVEQRYQTARKQGRVTKALFSQKDIKPLTQAMTRARTLFNELTLPYDDSYRIMPSKNYFEFVEAMAPLSRDFDTKKQEFLREYHTIQQRAAHDLGGLYNDLDYPPVQMLENRINFTIESSVIPSMTAFDELAGLTPEAIEDLKKQAYEGQQKKVEQALQDLFQRLFQSLHKAAVKLSDEDGVFRDTLLSNINGALEAVETLNLTNNQELIALANEVKTVIEGLSPDDLRQDKELRKQKVEETKKILNKMNEFF